MKLKIDLLCDDRPDRKTVIIDTDKHAKLFETNNHFRLSNHIHEEIKDSWPEMVKTLGANHKKMRILIEEVPDEDQLLHSGTVDTHFFCRCEKEDLVTNKDKADELLQEFLIEVGESVYRRCVQFAKEDKE